MGNCGSSLNCNQCFSGYKLKRCKNEIDINPDIAGIGVLTSFYLSAVGVSIVVIWGYLTQTLPTYVYGATDLYTLLLLKKRRRPFDSTDLNFQRSKVQQKRARIITNFIKVLGDQQVITGMAILIAALANRCRISIYEFNIVVFLAYFATFTHNLSLTVLRHYYYQHRTVRTCQVILAITFLVLFAFSFIVNTSLNNFEDSNGSATFSIGNVLQCVFDAEKFGKIVQFDYSVDSISILVFVTFLYGLALGDLFLEPPKHYLEPLHDTINKISDSLINRFLSNFGLSDAERREVIRNSELKYWAWLQPTIAVARSTNISVWYLIESYINSYMVVLPSIFLGIAYGTGSTSRAIWFSQPGLKPTNGLQILGFGQVVAMGLLALVFLTATEIVNEQNVMDDETVTKDTTESILLENVSSTVLDLQMGISHGSNSQNIESTVEAADCAKEGSAPSESTQLPRQEYQKPNRQDQNLSNGSKESFLKKYDGFLGFLVHIGVKKTQDDLRAIKADNFTIHDADPVTARNIAIISLVYFFFEVLLFTFIGAGWNFAETTSIASYLFYAWLGLRMLVLVKRVLNQIYFAKNEIANIQAKKTQPADNDFGDSVTALVMHLRPPPSQNSGSVIRRDSTTAEDSTGSERLRRQDTEADLGLVPPVKRKTFPPPTEG